MQPTIERIDLRRSIEAFPPERHSLIPILQEIQEHAGFVSKESIHEVSRYLRLPESKIYGVATFYNQFRLDAPGLHQIQVCRGTACHVRGSEPLLDTLESELGIKAGETTKDGVFSLEVVACLGACSIAPVIMIDGEFHGRLDKKRLAAVLDEYRTAEAE
jgi:NADH-quinone oxidoreductase subunit E